LVVPSREDEKEQQGEDSVDRSPLKRGRLSPQPNLTVKSPPSSNALPTPKSLTMLPAKQSKQSSDENAPPLNENALMIPKDLLPVVIGNNYEKEANCIIM
jgi:hypothetical protein